MNCLSFSDFWKFPNYKYGNCYTFNAQVPGKNKTRIADRGGTESGKFIQLIYFSFVILKQSLRVISSHLFHLRYQIISPVPITE